MTRFALSRGAAPSIRNPAFVARRSLGRLAPGGAAAADDRIVSYVFSDESVARDGHTIATDGWDLQNFLHNPVFLWCHQADQPPIGRVIYIRAVGTELRGSVRFASADEYPFADTIFRLTRGGFLNAASVSWLPIEQRRSTDKSRPGGIDFLRQELLEISAVPVPALPTALVDGRSAGIDIAPVCAWAERALDEGSAPIARKELEMVRSLAVAPRFYVPGYAAKGPGRAGASRADDVRSLAERAARARQRLSPSEWQSFGEFLNVVARTSSGSADPDRRLVRAPTGLGEADPTAGGFAVPDAYIDELIGSMYEEAVLAPLCDRRETDKPNNASLPAIDETSRADGSRWGGVLSYWQDEGITPPTTLPKFKSLTFTAHKLIALCVATGELIADVPLLDGHIRRAFAAEASFQLDKAILLGNAIGVPLGITNAFCTIQVAKDVGQSAATITASNITNMWSRLPAPCRKRAVWIANEDAEAQLEVAGAAGTAPMYYPRGANGNEFALVKGRPLLIAEQCPALGTVGDIVLADLSQYIILDGGLRSALSLGVDFLSDQGVFRFVLRVDGKPGWTSPITPYNGTATRSPLVTLAAR